ncbi:hypothetical protein GCM10010517_06640 [Streptosporangium fragile]|uniref:Asp23/Gls24 family envelope stress response protein n=1 Tax=Streptosporangium fragile TaxID=46186 RepID=A0ABN3VR03_9ACTN
MNDPARGTTSPARGTAEPAGRTAVATPEKADPVRGTAAPADAPVSQTVTVTQGTTAPARETAGPARGAKGPAGGAGGLARTVAATVRSHPDVADLTGGPFGTVATYLPGERVPGVALREDEVEVSIVVRLGRPLPEIADEVRVAVAPLVGGRPVNVHIGGAR